MAKLFYNQQIQKGNLIGSGINDVDYAYIDENYETNTATVTHEITDAEYNNLINGTHSIVVENNTVVLRDEVENPEPTLANVTLLESFATPDVPLTEFNRYKEQLETLKNKKPNHSQISKINDALNHMSTIDTSTLTEDIKKILLNANKYVAIEII